MHKKIKKEKMGLNNKYIHLNNKEKKEIKII